MSYSPIAHPMQFLLAVGFWAVLLFYVWPRLLATLNASFNQSFDWLLESTVGRLFPNRRRTPSKSMGEEYQEALDDPDLQVSEGGLYILGILLCSVAACSV